MHIMWHGIILKREWRIFCKLSIRKAPNKINKHYANPSIFARTKNMEKKNNGVLI